MLDFSVYNLFFILDLHLCIVCLIAMLQSNISHGNNVILVVVVTISHFAEVYLLNAHSHSHSFCTFRQGGGGLALYAMFSPENGVRDLSNCHVKLSWREGCRMGKALCVKSHCFHQIVWHNNERKRWAANSSLDGSPTVHSSLQLACICLLWIKTYRAWPVLSQ